jgi:hypothetical protein
MSLWHQATGVSARASENARRMLRNGIVFEVGSNYAGKFVVYE